MQLCKHVAYVVEHTIVVTSEGGFTVTYINNVMGKGELFVSDNKVADM